MNRLRDVRRHCQYLLRERGGKNAKGCGTMLDRISLILVIIGALNWLLIGLFQFDAVAWICGGQTALLSRIIYAIVGLAGLWSISLLFKEREPVRED